MTSIVTFSSLRAFTVTGHGICAGDHRAGRPSGTVSGRLAERHALAVPEGQRSKLASPAPPSEAGACQASLAKVWRHPRSTSGLPVVTSAIAGGSETISVPQIRAAFRR